MKGGQVKTIEEIRNELGMSVVKFCEAIGMSKRTYLGRFDGSQPKWLLKDIVDISKLNKGEVRVNLDDKVYDIKVKEITD